MHCIIMTSFFGSVTHKLGCNPTPGGYAPVGQDSDHADDSWPMGRASFLMMPRCHVLFIFICWIQASPPGAKHAFYIS